MYVLDWSHFPGTAAVSSFTQTMGFESGITVVQARSIVNDRFDEFSFEADNFLRNEYKRILTKRLKKQKTNLDCNIKKLNNEIVRLKESRDDVSAATDQLAKRQASLVNSERRLSFLKNELGTLEIVLANKFGEIDAEVAKKESYVSVLKKKPKIIEVSLSKKDNLRNSLKSDLVADANGINIYIVSASISDRAHWFNVLRIGNTVNVADAAGDSLGYLTQTYVEDSESSFKYNYNVKRLQYSSGRCETFSEKFTLIF